MEHVAHDDDSPSLERTPAAPQDEEVEKTLRRVLARSVARVHHVRPRQLIGEPGRSADLRVAHDEDIHSHGLKRTARVGQSLALDQGEPLAPDRQVLGAQPLLGDFERAARPRRGLEDQVDDREPRDRGRSLRAPAGGSRRLPARFRPVQKIADLPRVEPRQAEQMGSAEAHPFAAPLSVSSTSQVPSRSSTLTLTC